jgi:hypothetical protein
MRKAMVTAAVMLVGVGLTVPEALAQAKGTVALERARFTVADAVAYKTDSGIEVALLSAKFDRLAAAKDKKIDSFDVMRMMNVSAATLRIAADGSFNCIDFKSEGGGGSSCNSDFTSALKLTAHTADRVAGTLKLNAGGQTADVTFDLKVESVATRAGTALAADGGEPGRAVMAHFAAIEKGDFKALMATAPPEQRKMMQEAEKAGEAKEMFGMLRAMSPRKVKVTGGTVDGDSAQVDYEGVEDGKAVKGTADVVRMGGQWYLTDTSNR